MTGTESYTSMVDHFSAAARQFSGVTEQVARFWQVATKLWTEQLEMIGWVSGHAGDLQRIWDLSVRTAEENLEAAARWASVVNAMSDTVSRQLDVVNNVAQKHFDVVDGYVS